MEAANSNQTTIPFLDLRAQYRAIKPEIDEAIQRVVENCDFVGGRAVDEFEAAFAEFCQVQHCIGVSNGSDALYLALRALNIGPGDEVITVPNTFIATAASITRAGASVRFVDVEPQTLQMDVTKLERAITHRTKAIMPVHLYGQFCNMEAVLEIARQHELVVIEDAAQAHGAKYHGRMAGGMGKIACFSFYPGKNLGAYGDGGAIVTNDKALDDRIRRLRDHGRLTKYEHGEVGYNHRLDTLQAAVLNVKLRHLPKWVERRREVATLYQQYLKACRGVELLTEPEGQEGAYHLFVVQVNNRQEVQDRLHNQGIATGIHYPVPLHLQPAYRSLKVERGSFPVTEASAERILSLPIYAEMTAAMVERVATALKQAVS